MSCQLPKPSQAGWKSRAWSSHEVLRNLTVDLGIKYLALPTERTQPSIYWSGWRVGDTEYWHTRTWRTVFLLSSFWMHDVVLSKTDTKLSIMGRVQRARNVPRSLPSVRAPGLPFFDILISDPCDVRWPFQEAVCCAHVFIAFSMDSGPVESRQNLANGNQ